MLTCAAQDAVGYKVDWTRHLWCDIGAGPWEVSVVDVLLLGVIFVSDGGPNPDGPNGCGECLFTSLLSIFDPPQTHLHAGVDTIRARSPWAGALVLPTYVSPCRVAFSFFAQSGSLLPFLLPFRTQCLYFLSLIDPLFTIQNFVY